MHVHKHVDTQQKANGPILILCWEALGIVGRIKVGVQRVPVAWLVAENLHVVDIQSQLPQQYRQQHNIGETE